MDDCIHSWTRFIIVSKSFRKCKKCNYTESYKEIPRLIFKDSITLDFWTPPDVPKKKTQVKKNIVPLHFIAWKQGHWVSQAKPKKKEKSSYIPKRTSNKLKMMDKENLIEDDYIKIVKI